MTRADSETPTTITTDRGRLAVPTDATPEQAAAIAAAVGAQIRDREAAAAATAAGREETDSWAGRRFGFAGRLAALSGHARRVPRGTPIDGWTAAARLDGL